MEKQIQTEKKIYTMLHPEEVKKVLLKEDGFKLNWTKINEARKNLEAKEIFKDLGIEVFE